MNVFAVDDLNVNSEKGESQMPVTQCGDKPNCVSSKDQRNSFFIEPIKTENSKEKFELLVEKIKSLKRTELKAHEKGVHAHFVFTTWLMSYKDDVYLSVNEKEGVIDIMSQSRVGHWDMGKNRKRLNELKDLIN